jgi:hypothetical protein
VTEDDITMFGGRGKTGVYIVRIVAQGERFVITALQNPDIRGTASEIKTSFADIESAVAAVRSFLKEFTSDQEATRTEKL